MELAFVVSALRRRFWVVTLFVLLGSLPGLLSDPPTSTTYESSSVLLVTEPTRFGETVFAAEPDRYVVSQLQVLESTSLTERVANRVAADLAIDISGSDVAVLTSISNSPGTDIVEITAQGRTGELAASIAQSYAELYVEGLATTDEDQEQRADLVEQIQALENRLLSLDTRLQEALTPFLPRDGDATPDPIPPAEMVDPDAVSQRLLVLDELTRLKASLNELDQQSRLRVNTSIISPAVVPDEPVPPAGNFLLAGGLVAGIMAGVVVALTWARFSTKVLDEDAAEDILGAPVVSELPYYRSLARKPLAAFQSLPRSATTIVDQLCVRAEALARIGEPLTVVVTGTMRNAGSTTLALAMAERFAAGGSSVVLIDGDVHDPRITTVFNGQADGGVPAIVASGGSLTDQRGRTALTRTMDPAVSVLGLGPDRASAALRRDTVPTVLDVARRNGDIVVIDGGPALDLASTLQFANLVDAVVLAVPLSRQKADPLTDLARQLGSLQEKLLPVMTSPSRRSARGNTSRSDSGLGSGGRTSVDAANGMPNGVVATDGPNGTVVTTGRSAADMAASYSATKVTGDGVGTASGPIPNNGGDEEVVEAKVASKAAPPPPPPT